MPFDHLPKVELHLHLDCSLSFDVVHRIDPSITPEAYRTEFIAPAKCTNLADFLTRPPRQVALMQEAEPLRLATLDLFDQLQRDQVIYAEIRFAPLLHLEKGLSAERVVEIVEEATRSASRESGVEARLILCTLRHFSADQSMQTVRLVERFKGTHVVALDIAGDEAGYPTDAHIPAFAYAAQRGIARTAHAGEAAGPASVWETLRDFRPSRIGHGVRSAEDPALLERLRQERIHLELCPSSNVQTNVCDTYAGHPIDRLYRSGLSLGVSTDTRTVTNITLTEEYQRLHETFGWDHRHFLRCNLNALQSAFIPLDVKRSLEERLRQGYARLSSRYICL